MIFCLNGYRAKDIFVSILNGSVENRDNLIE